MTKQLSPSTLARHANALAAVLGLDLVRGHALPSIAKREVVKGAYWTACPKMDALGYATERANETSASTLRVKGICVSTLSEMLGKLEELESGSRPEHLPRFAAWIPSMSGDRILGTGYTLDHAISQASKPLIDTDFPPDTEIEAALMTEEMALAVRRDGMDAVRGKLRGGSLSLSK